MEKPAFTKDQLVSASSASKNFGKLRELAKNNPIAVTDNGNVDTIVMGYAYFEHLYQRLNELEEREESRILIERIDRLEKDPSLALPWRSIRRSGEDND